MLFLAGVCGDEMKILLGFIKSALQIVQIVIPIGLIVWGTIDLGKAVVASKEDEIKKAQQLLVKRALSALLVFVLSIIVGFAMGLVGNKEWKACWTQAFSCKEETYNPLTGECCKIYYNAETGTCEDVRKTN